MFTTNELTRQHLSKMVELSTPLRRPKRPDFYNSLKLYWELAEWEKASDDDFAEEWYWDNIMLPNDDSFDWREQGDYEA